MSGPGGGNEGRQGEIVILMSCRPYGPAAPQFGELRAKGWTAEGEN